MQPRWYQADLVNKTREAWSQGYKNAIVVSPPRSGKTPMKMWLAGPFLEQRQGVVINAHREELVRQICRTAAIFGYEHNVIAPSDVISEIVSRQIAEFGRSFYNQHATLWIGSVQTMNARSDKFTKFAPRVGLWMTDEAHHVLPSNQWGKVISMFPNAYGAGFTATPGRTDNKSLARSQGGIFDIMIKGCTARQLINEGFICDYRIIAPKSSIDRSQIRVGSTGDYTKAGLRSAHRDSHITGDCVESYIKYAMGTQTVCFACDIQHANDIADKFREHSIRVETVSGKTEKSIRKELMAKFERGVFQVLVNVDLFGEGLDVKGIETVIFGRPTQSYTLYAQQFFRPLTLPASGKKTGLIIDHVGNVGYFGKTHGAPDTYNEWELEGDCAPARRRNNVAADPIKTCTNCNNTYDYFLKVCPYCGYTEVPEGREIKHVEGDLEEVDPETLRLLRGEADKIIGDPLVPRDVPGHVAAGIQNRWDERRTNQIALRNSIATWAGYFHERGKPDHWIYRKFYVVFGLDIMTAQTKGSADSMKLKERIDNSLHDLLAKDNNG